MLGILERKGYVTHEERGRAFYYRSKRRRNEIRYSVVNHVIKTFFNGSAMDLAAALIQPRRRFSQTELDELADLIGKARKEGR